MRRLLPTAGLALLLTLAGAGPASAATLCVNPGGTGGCFATIQGALNAAAGSGDTINVAAGTYNESKVLVDKSITINGAGMDQTIIDGQNIAPSGHGLLEVQTTQGNVTVSDLTVRNAGITTATVRTAISPRATVPGQTYTFDGVEAEGVNDGTNLDRGLYSFQSQANIVFKNGAITGTGGNAIEMDQVTGAVDIDGNTLAPAAAAALTAGPTVDILTHGNVNVTAAQRVRNNTISTRGVKFSGAFLGFAGTGTFSDVAAVTGNTFTGIVTGGALELHNDDNGAEGQISNAVVSGNTMSGTDAAGTRGVSISGVVTGTELSANSITDFEDGLWLGANGGEPSGTVASRNRLVGNTAAGARNLTSNTLFAEDNWWGCNAGPSNAGCDSTAPTNVIDHDPWLQLRADISPSTLEVGSTGTATAKLTVNSSGAPLSGPFFTGPSLGFGATGGSIAPALVPLASTGEVQSTYTAGSSAGNFQVSATLDNATATAPVLVAGPPVLDTTDAALAYTEGDGAVPVDAGLTVTDLDSSPIVRAVVGITNYKPAEDELSFTDQAGITGSYDSGVGGLTLTGTASVSDYQAALRSVRYRNKSDTPDTTTRTIAFQAEETGAEPNVSSVVSRNATVAAVNDVPAVAATPGTTAYTPGAAPAPVDGGLSVSDVDDANLESASVRIASGFGAGDELVFTNQSGITGTYDSGTGVLTLAGSASKAAYQSALRSVTFRSTGPPAGGSWTIEVRVNDGSAESAPAPRTISSTVLPGACANLRVGTSGDDVFHATTAGDSLFGGPGLDQLFGYEGDDCLDGGLGDDRLYGGRGADALEGRDGADKLYGQEDADTLRGGAGGDKLRGEGVDVYRGHAGNDRLYAADGEAEDVHCGSGSDVAVVDDDDRVRGCERVRRSR